jgi:hypothetical protein
LISSATANVRAYINLAEVAQGNVQFAFDKLRGLRPLKF